MSEFNLIERKYIQRNKRLFAEYPWLWVIFRGEVVYRDTLIKVRNGTSKDFARSFRFGQRWYQGHGQPPIHVGEVWVKSTNGIVNEIRQAPKARNGLITPEAVFFTSELHSDIDFGNGEIEYIVFVERSPHGDLDCVIVRPPKDTSWYDHLWRIVDERDKRRKAD